MEMTQNTYEEKELDIIIARAKEKINELITNDQNYFGNEYGVLARLKSILDPYASNGTLNIPTHLCIKTTSDIMRCVDLTILDKNATETEVIVVAKRAAKEKSATVCVYPEHIYLVNQVMVEENVNNVPPIAVVGFPFVKDTNLDTTNKTIAESEEAISLGAKEIDMVLPITFRENIGDYNNYFNYIKAVVDSCHTKEIPVKVILETAYLTDEQISLASLISKIAGADWVKTSTGFAETDKFAEGRRPEEKGATPRSVAIMRRTVGDTSLNDLEVTKHMGVKASGGVRNREQAILVLNAGADRIGASGGINIEVNNQNTTIDIPNSKY